jgi:hypothetical protein
MCLKRVAIIQAGLATAHLTSHVGVAETRAAATLFLKGVSYPQGRQEDFVLTLIFA